MTINPEKLRIELYPTEVLRMKAEPIELNDEVRAVALRMIDLMKGAQGIGLAAPQIGLSWRMFVAHVPADPNLDSEDDQEETDPDLPISCDSPQIFINPEIIEFAGELEPYEEGCLSLPGITGEVQRPAIVTVKAITLDGQEVTMRASGLLARCWQHEIDHLDGVLILDKMNQMSRFKNRSRIKQMEKAAKR
ncbi:MAG: peptide deformylase [Phycisphaerales bacterium]|jgi:peptide deformylase|nr:peptide deformylase [Phycisphaerales bacterium]